MKDLEAESSERGKSPFERSLLEARICQIPVLLPGLLAVAIIAWLSIWLTEYVGTSLMGFAKPPISAVMVAILLGMLVSNAVSLPDWLRPGVQFAVKKILRLGIILLGIRLSISQVVQLGALGVPIVALCILGALLFTTRLSKWLSLPDRVGTLIAVGTSICGVSAIVATAPAIEAEDEEVAYAVGIITVFGIAAMFAYPYLAHSLFSGDPVRSGLFLGTAIHETAQVTGAGVLFADIYSLPRALDVATVAKLVRNAFMALVIPIMAVYYARQRSAHGGTGNTQVGFTRFFPLFIVGFLGFAALRSTGDAWIKASSEAFGILDSTAWEQLCDLVASWAVNLMVTALAGVGLSTSFGAFRGLGAKPFAVGLGAALTVGLVSLGVISLLGYFAAF